MASIAGKFWWELVTRETANIQTEVVLVFYFFFRSVYTLEALNKSDEDLKALGYSKIFNIT